MDEGTTPTDIYELVARHFHEAYERLAPDFGYKTREASAVPWEDVPEANKRLMEATVAEVFEQVGYWRADVSDQCQHCEPDRLYQRWSKDKGMYYDAEDEDDLPVFVVREAAHNVQDPTH